ncbi:MAG: alpha/beta hydrolase [Ignavibacteriales bacterium]|nr:alpha/beta hydrolase [Ignavibacteriales bacterium]
MDLITSTLYHKIVPPRKKLNKLSPAIILLHGRGADENDLLGLAEYFDESLFIVSVRAPFDFMNTGGYTWFDIQDIGSPDIKMFEESYDKLLQFIKDVCSGYPIDPGKIILFGFSMGTMMSLSVALTQPQLVKAVVANSGILPEQLELEYKWEDIKGKAFFIGHGIHDSIIPISYARRAKDLLLSHGVDLIYREYEMDHQIDEEGLNDIIKWIAKQL